MIGAPSFAPSAIPSLACSAGLLPSSLRSRATPSCPKFPRQSTSEAAGMPITTSVPSPPPARPPETTLVGEAKRSRTTRAFFRVRSQSNSKPCRGVAGFSASADLCEDWRLAASCPPEIGLDPSRLCKPLLTDASLVLIVSSFMPKKHSCASIRTWHEIEPVAFSATIVCVLLASAFAVVGTPRSAPVRASSCMPSGSSGLTSKRFARPPSTCGHTQHGPAGFRRRIWLGVRLRVGVGRGTSSGGSWASC
mmetsp:Transcript_28663/g.75841  ORF Transcript_28663/g.75841 Transcript_28663/m.75841 type:complete len:250 (-) Transcript_28663:1234-1983(-)